MVALDLGKRPLLYITTTIEVVIIILVVEHHNPLLPPTVPLVHMLGPSSQQPSSQQPQGPLRTLDNHLDL
jgi:hypothetical protein